MRQISQLQQKLGLVDAHSIDKMRKALNDMQKELSGNADKLSAYNKIKTQLDDLEASNELLTNQIADSNIQMRELERLTKESEETQQSLHKQVEERDALLVEAEATHKGLESQNGNLTEELDRSHEKALRVQQLLDESRKNEAFLKTKISSIETEAADNMETEQHAQGELEKKLEDVRGELRGKKKEVDKLSKELAKQKKEAEEGGKKQIEDAINESKNKMQKEYETTITELRNNLKERTDNFDKSEKKLKVTSEQSMKFEEMLKSAKAEKLSLLEKMGTLEIDLGDAHGASAEKDAVHAAKQAEMDAAHASKQAELEGLHESSQAEKEAELKKSRESRVGSLAASLAMKAKVVANESSKKQDGDALNSAQTEIQRLEEEKAQLQEENSLLRKEKELTAIQIEKAAAKANSVPLEAEKIVNGEVEVEKLVEVMDGSLSQSEEEVLKTQLAHLMQVVSEHKIEKEQHQLELDKHKFETSEQAKIAEEHKLLVEERESKLRDMGNTLQQQQMKIEMFEAQMANGDDPEAAAKIAEQQDRMKAQMDEQVDASRLERQQMEDSFKAKEDELQRKADELHSVRRDSVDIGKFAQLELELDKIPALESNIESLQIKVDCLSEENANLKASLEELASAGGGGGGGAGGTLTLMMKSQLATLKTENAILSKAKEDADFLRLEREEMSLQVQKTNGEMAALTQEVEDLHMQAVMKTASSALPDMMKQAKLKKERGEAQQMADEQIHFLQAKYDSTQLLLVEQASNVVDYILAAEENIKRDGENAALLDEFAVEGNEVVLKVKNCLDKGVEVEMVELGVMLESEGQGIVGYLEARMKGALGSTRVDSTQLREMRDSKKKGGGGGAPMIDLMAKQREFRMKKQVKDLETKYEKTKEEKEKGEKEMGEKIAVTGERADTMEREVQRVQLQYVTLVPQIKAYDAIKVTHGELVERFNLLELLQNETSSDLATKVGQVKSFSTDLFKCNIKLKNTTKDREDLENKFGKSVIEIKDFKKEVLGLTAKLKEIADAEAQRLGDMESVECQVGVEVAEAGCQSDFMGREVTLRQSNGVQGFPGKMWARPVVTVGFTDRKEDGDRVMRNQNSLLGLPMIGGAAGMGGGVGGGSSWGGGGSSWGGGSMSMAGGGPETDNLSISRVLRSAGGSRGGGGGGRSVSRGV